MKTRVISAAVMLPAVLAAIVIGGWPFTLLVIIAVLLAGLEYRRMAHLMGYELSLAFIWSATLVWFVDLLLPEGPWLSLGLALVVLATSLWQLFHREHSSPTVTWALTLAGGLYLGVGGAYIHRLRGLEDGLWWILTALPVIWVGESAAYYIGKRWGDHKAIPGLSPGKSWEGYIAEAISALLVGALLGWVWPQVAGEPITLNPWRGLILGAVLAVTTPFGDLFVSMIKREVHLDDSGKLIPGHGGVFDRIDSLLWAGFFAWIVATLCG